MTGSNQHSIADEFLLVRNGLKPRASVGTRNEAMLASIRLEEQYETLREAAQSVYDLHGGPFSGVWKTLRETLESNPARSPEEVS